MLKLYHKNMELWKVALSLIEKIYCFTAKFPATERYGLTSQLRRAAISVCSNFAEGYARRTDAEKRRFFEIARSSLVEVDAQIEIAFRLKYIEEDTTTELEQIVTRLFAMLSGLIKTYSSAK